MSELQRSAFAGVLAPPVNTRETKPRQRGITMVIDKGLGLKSTADLFESAGHYIDFLKLGFGTALLYSDDWLYGKIRLARANDIQIYPGGTLLELAVLQGREMEFIERVVELGFTALEVSEGTIELDREIRDRLIETGVSLGLTVLSEVGKKDPQKPLVPAAVADAVRRDLGAGASWVIIEGRDSGRGVGVYDDRGALRADLAERIIERVGNPDRLIWEAPRTEQHNVWLMKLGPNANFGNVQPEDVITLEATRQALRGDTLKSYVGCRKSFDYCRNL